MSTTSTTDTFIFEIGTYSGDHTAALDGPGGLDRAAALDYLTGRLRDLADGTPPGTTRLIDTASDTTRAIVGDADWPDIATAALDRAEARPTRALSVGASDSVGCIVTAYPAPPVPEYGDARAALVDALADLLAVNGGRIAEVRDLVPDALTIAGRHFQAERRADLIEPTEPEPDAGFTLTIELGNAGMLTGGDVSEALRDVAGKLPAEASDDGIVRDGNGQTVGRWSLVLPTCEGCGDGREGGGVPGVRWPVAINGDDSHQWIERCDTCERFESDGDAAEALEDEGVIPGFAWLVPDGCLSETPYALTR